MLILPAILIEKTKETAKKRYYQEISNFYNRCNSHEIRTHGIFYTDRSQIKNNSTAAVIFAPNIRIFEFLKFHEIHENCQLQDGTIGKN